MDEHEILESLKGFYNAMWKPAVVGTLREPMVSNMRVISEERRDLIWMLEELGVDNSREKHMDPSPTTYTYMDERSSLSSGSDGSPSDDSDE